MRAALFWTAPLFAALGHGCGAPPAPAPPDLERIGPPPGAAAKCTPPWARNVGQAWYLLADLDEGVSCTAFLEQEDCVLGVFRDCTDLRTAERREWQGTIDGDRKVRLTAVYPEGGVRAPRAPRCCDGVVEDHDGLLSASLACRRTDCENQNDLSHVGLYLERLEPGASPEDALLPPVRVAGTDGDPPARLLASGARRELWTLTAGGALWVAPASGVSAAVRLSSVAGEPVDLFASTAEDAVYAVGTLGITRIDPQTRAEGARFDGSVLAAAVTSAGLLVAVERASGSRLVLLDPERLEEREGRDLPELRVSGLAALPEGAGGLAVLTAEGAPRLSSVSASLELETALDLRTFANLGVGETVPRFAAALDARTVGFLGRCHDAATEARCYFEADLLAGTLRRVGVPDGAELVAMVHVAAASGPGRVYVASRDGLLTPILRASLSPRLQARVRPASGLVALSRAPAGEALYMLVPQTGEAVGLAL